MKIFKLVLGVVSFLLGVLWALQGADVIHIQPVLCVADCKPLVGGSFAWLVIGILAMLSGASLLFSALRRSGPNG